MTESSGSHTSAWIWITWKAWWNSDCWTPTPRTSDSVGLSGAEDLLFQQVPRWCWCLDHTWEPLTEQIKKNSFKAWQLRRRNLVSQWESGNKGSTVEPGIVVIAVSWSDEQWVTATAWWVFPVYGDRATEWAGAVWPKAEEVLGPGTDTIDRVLWNTCDPSRGEQGKAEVAFPKNSSLSLWTKGCC